MIVFYIFEGFGDFLDTLKKGPQEQFSQYTTWLCNNGVGHL